MKAFHLSPGFLFLAAMAFSPPALAGHQSGDRVREFKKEVSAASQELQRIDDTRDSGCIVHYDRSPGPAVKALKKDLEKRISGVENAVGTLFIRLGAVTYSKEEGSRYMYTLAEKIQATKDAREAIAREKSQLERSIWEYENGSSRIATNKRKDCAETPRRLKAPVENLKKALGWIDVMEHDFGEIQAWLENMPEAEHIPKLASR